jgi:hypothetical protein
MLAAVLMLVLVLALLFLVVLALFARVLVVVEEVVGLLPPVPLAVLLTARLLLRLLVGPAFFATAPAPFAILVVSLAAAAVAPFETPAKAMQAWLGVLDALLTLPALPLTTLPLLSSTPCASLSVLPTAS